MLLIILWVMSVFRESLCIGLVLVMMVVFF